MDKLTSGPLAATPRLQPIPTFLGAAAGDIEDLSPGAVAFAGVFCDHYSGGAPGGRFAARQLRYASADAVPGESSRLTGNCIDLGDLNVFPLEPRRNEETLCDQSARIAGTGARLLALGSDYSVTPALVRGLLAAAPDAQLRVIRISRRLDFAPTELAGAHMRGSASARLASDLADGAGSITLLGVRGPASLEAVAAAKGARIIPAHRLRDHGEAIAAELRDEVTSSAGAIYLSIDIDVLATMGPASTGDGLTVDEFLGLLDGLHGLPFLAGDVTGFVPVLDLHGREATQAVLRIVRKAAGLLRTETPPCR